MVVKIALIVFLLFYKAELYIVHYALVTANKPTDCVTTWPHNAVDSNTGKQSIVNRNEESLLNSL